MKPSDVHNVIFNDCKATSSYTQKGLLKIVKCIFNLAIEEAIIVRNPAVGIRVRCAEANQAVLNKSEVEILLSEARRTEHRFFPHWMLALLTGMRSGELYSLRWTDVNIVTGKISISKASKGLKELLRRNRHYPSKVSRSSCNLYNANAK